MNLYDVRSLFPLISESNVVYFASCSHGPLSKPVKQALLDYIDDWGMKGMDWDHWMVKYEELRAEAASLLRASVDEIAIVQNVSSGLATVASALKYGGERSKILLSDLNFPTVGHVWSAQRRHGVTVEIIKSVNWRINLQDIEKRVDDRTLAVSEPHVCYQSGFTYESLRGLAEIAHGHDALLIVDDAQSTGVIDIDVKKEDVDVLVTTTSKYLLGGAGLGILYVRRNLIEELEPVLTGWFSRENPFTFNIHDFNYARSARRFETGTPSVPAVLTAIEGIKLLRRVGIKDIEKHVRSLVSYATERGQELGLDVLSPVNPESMGPMFVFKASDSIEISRKLLERGIMVSPRGSAIRVSMHMFNTRDEVDRLLDILKDITASPRLT